MEQKMRKESEWEKGEGRGHKEKTGKDGKEMKGMTKQKWHF